MDHRQLVIPAQCDSHVRAAGMAAMLECIVNQFVENQGDGNGRPAVEPDIAKLRILDGRTMGDQGHGGSGATHL